jgi:hypothetical protein
VALLASIAVLACLSILSAAPVGIATGGYQFPIQRLGTGQMEWAYARSVGTTGYVTADDATPAATAKTWTDTGSYFLIPPEWNYVSVAFLAWGDGNGAGNPASGTWDCNVYVVDPYSSWDHVASFSCAVGDLEASHNPVTGVAFRTSGIDDPNSKWAEGNFTPGTDYDWITTIDYTGCTNGIGRINFDAGGARVLVVLIDNMALVTRIYPLVKGR